MLCYWGVRGGRRGRRPSPAPGLSVPLPPAAPPRGRGGGRACMERAPTCSLLSAPPPMASRLAFLAPESQARLGLLCSRVGHRLRTQCSTVASCSQPPL